jgi:O-antigen ligase
MVLLALSITMMFFPQAVGARWALYSETLSPRSADFEVSHRVWNYPVEEFLKALSSRNWDTGYGIGTASLGAQYVSAYLKKRYSSPGVESGYGVLILEFGIMGLILWLAWTVSLVFAAWKVVHRLKGEPTFPVALSVSFYAFLLLFPITFTGMQAYQNYLMNAYLWLLVGVLFRLPALTARNAARPLETKLSDGD